jgi:hypothetical protein
MKKLFFLMAVGGLLLSQTAFADTRDEVYARMQRCRAIQDDRAWLDCTYGAQQPMRAKLGLQPAPDFQQRLVPMPSSVNVAPANPGPAYAAPAAPRAAQPAAMPHRSASFLQVLTGSAPAVTSSPLASVQYDATGAFIVTLQNGQSWHQENMESSDKVRFKIGTQVTIKPAAFGSYNLQAIDSPHVYKVKPKA